MAWENILIMERRYEDDGGVFASLISFAGS